MILLSVSHINQADVPKDIGLELRLDLIDHAELADFFRPDRLILATYRTQAHLGKGTAREKGWKLRQQCAELGAHWIDVEWDEPQLKEKIAWIHAKNGKVVLSNHVSNQDQVPLEHPHFNLLRNQDVVKWINCDTDYQCFLIQKSTYKKWEQRQSHLELTTFSMGPEVWGTRLTCLQYGAPFTFAIPNDSEALAPGMLNLKKAQTLIGKPNGEGTWPFFAVVGSPVGHSKSPEYHSPKLHRFQPGAMFLPLPCEDETQFAKLVDTFPNLNGFAITKPLKEKLVSWSADDCPLGAINTLIREEGNWRGFNTDFYACLELLKPFRDLKKLRVLGYGGLGKAVCHAGLTMGMQVEVSNRTPKVISQGAKWLPWAAREKEGCDILVQATSVGMDGISCPVEKLPQSTKVIFETIYEPLETPFYQLGKGREKLNGLNLFETQANFQNDFFKSTLF